MGSIITRAKKLRIIRSSIQTLALIALNLRVLSIWFPGLALSGMMSVCAPGFYCHGCPWATMACPLGVIINFSKLGVFPFIALGTIGLIGVFGGRFVCGWLCPFGLLQDVLYKIRTRKFRIPRKLEYVKYVLLVTLVFAVPYFWPHTKYTFCEFCPSAVLESVIPYGFMGNWDPASGLFGGFNFRFFYRAGITLAVLLFVIFVSRGFCRTLCPLGAMFGVFNKFSIFRYSQTFHKCNGCGACAKVCPVGIDPIKEINDAECIRCYECTTTKHIKMGTK